MNSDVVFKNFRTITFEYEKLVSQSNFINSIDYGAISILQLFVSCCVLIVLPRATLRTG